MDFKLITKYFPHLTPLQRQQFVALEECYRFWNARINVISRKDIDKLYLHHVLHSLSVAKLLSFPKGSNVWDVGTGGGFPGIPLSIFFPEVQFFLCDSIAKKIHVVHEVVQALELKNVSAAQVRAEEVTQTFDFVVSRAVAPLAQFIPLVYHKVGSAIINLKGGDLEKEIEACSASTGIPRNQFEVVPISQWFDEPFFEEKRIVIFCTSKQKSYLCSPFLR